MKSLILLDTSVVHLGSSGLVWGPSGLQLGSIWAPSGLQWVGSIHLQLQLRIVDISLVLQLFCSELLIFPWFYNDSGAPAQNRALTNGNKPIQGNRTLIISLRLSLERMDKENPRPRSLTGNKGSLPAFVRACLHALKSLILLDLSLIHISEPTRPY